MPVQLAFFKREGFRNARIEPSDFSVSKVVSEMAGLDAIHSDGLPDSFFRFRKARAIVIAQLLNFAVVAIVAILRGYQATKTIWSRTCFLSFCICLY